MEVLLNTWRSELKKSHGVWTSEIRLRTGGFIRKGKVNRLLKRLREPVKEVISESGRVPVSE